MNATTCDTFLQDVDVREIPWAKPVGGPAALTTTHVLIGAGTDGLEVALATAASAPKHDDVRSLWKLRWGRRAAPVLLVVCYPDGDMYKAHVCGTKDDPAVIPSLDLAHLERICAAALGSPDPSIAERTIHRLLVGQKDQLIAGLTNQGLFASHELRHGVPNRNDWETQREIARSLLSKSGAELIQALGYKQTPHGSTAQILSVDGATHAVAVLLDDHEVFDRPAARFGASSPVSIGLKIAKDQHLPWLIVTRSAQMRLYPAKTDVGVGRKGQAETFIDLDLALLTDEDAAYLTLLFGHGALADGGTVSQILAASVDHATALGKRLRDRVYIDVVPKLAVAVANQVKADDGRDLTEEDLDEAYHRTLIILFRLLFVAYAEDRGLLPYQRNPQYTKKALKTLAREFTEQPDQEFDPHATDRWTDLLAVWKAVDDGNSEWSVPAYNGGLFAADAQHPSGQAIRDMRLTNAEIGPALRTLMVDIGDDGTLGPVDFRSLSVREFGTIYEGLLESSLSVAPTDLAVDEKTKTYLPAAGPAKVEVKAGDVYFHNASGARKATGSYFTKAFAVEHLLDTALDPALATHLEKVKLLLDAGDDARAAELFFDFRVADLAMGSGHFLVAAIDRIEDQFGAFLTGHPIPAINNELDRLAAAASEALGANRLDIEIERSALLRRQIARRCIYGLDLNMMAVELARLGIWIHTFVPGLPMSALDHGLVVGNSLTGIGSVQEVLNTLEPGNNNGQVSLFADQIEEALTVARDRLRRVARTAEASKKEVKEAAKAHAEAMEDAGDAKALLDAAVGVRLGILPLPTGPEEAMAAGRSAKVQAKVAELAAAHMPYLFPEVFLREVPGFDVILGNPPWEKVRWEAAPYWVGLFPGLMAMRDKARDAKIAELRETNPFEAAHERAQQTIRSEQQDLFKKTFVLRGGTHLEMSQLMLERALLLTRKDGHLGLVLPRQSMVLAGWKNLRRALVENHDLRIVQGRNHGQWIFDDVEERIAVVLLAVGPLRESLTRVWVATNPTHVANVSDNNAIKMTLEDLGTYSETQVIPWFAGSEDRAVFEKIRQFPRLASGLGWVTGRHDARWDFRGTGPDKSLAERSDAPGAWRILMTAHVDPYTFDPDEPFKQFVHDLDGLIAKHRGVSKNANGDAVLDETHPLIIVRHPSTVDNTRTMIATALPESGILHNKGYIHAISHQEGTSEYARLALLGLLNTVAVDWWVRRFVDRHITAPVVNQIPIPDLTEHQVRRAADISAVLLHRHSSTRLAGGIDLREWARKVDSDLRALSDIELLAAMESLTLHGYGLNSDDFMRMCVDFNLRGTPQDLREAVLAHYEARKGMGEQ